MLHNRKAEEDLGVSGGRGAHKREQYEPKESVRTPSVTQLPDGTVCIGEGCMVLRIPPNSDQIDIDVTDCDDIAKQALMKAVGIEGRATAYSITKKKGAGREDQGSKGSSE